MSEAATPLTVILFVIALLYASVGQAGASGYLAAMAMFHYAPATMKITALSLNLVVGAIGAFQFWRAGYLSGRAFFPFGVLGAPFSLIGGAVQLPPHVYHPVAGVILLLSGALMFRAARTKAASFARPPETPPVIGALAVGGVIGFMSGATGTGGGVFLSPIIVAMNWAGMRQMAGVTAAYNLLNSAAALIGAFRSFDAAPPSLPIWLVSVFAGGAIGAHVGSRYLPDAVLRAILALILVAAGAKLLATH